MTEILNIIIVTAIWVLGLTIATQEEMVFHNVRIWAEEKKSKWLEPVILCEWCMPSIHSVIGYLFCFLSGVVNYDARLFIMYPIVVMGSSFLTGMMWGLYKYLNISMAYKLNIEKLSYWEVKEKKQKHFRNNQNNNHGKENVKSD